MAKRTKDSRNSITVKLDSPTDEVDAKAVALTMQAILEIIEETSKELQEDQRLLVKARPFQPGSFEIPLELIIPSSTTLFESPVFDMIVATLRQYFDVRRLLARGEFNRDDLGEPAPQIRAGETLLAATRRILVSRNVEQSIALALESMTADTAIENFKVFRGDEEEPFVVVERPEFETFRASSAMFVEEPSREVSSREFLSIASIVFEGRAAWTFNRSGVRISARIEDEDFSERVQTGAEVFSAGDRLDVDLNVAQEYDPVTNDYLNKKYRILHVYGHVRRERQARLFDDK